VGGCTHFIVHSRKCLLNGLNPHENRTVPPLKYEVVKQLKQDFPALQFTINGGIKTYEQIESFLDPNIGLTGVMVGRLAYEHPWVLSDIDRRVYNLPNQARTRKELLEVYAAYGDREVAQNPKMAWPTLMKPIINLFYNEPHSAVYRRLLSDRELYKKVGKYSEVVKHAVEELEKLNPEAVNRKPPV
jgi:tRNA-dihydrouridine synthase A